MKPLVVANWKMNTDLSEAIVLATTIKNKLAEMENAPEVVICPPYLWLYPVAEILQKTPTNVKLGAQDVFWEKDGAYTGEISVAMLKKMVDYVIVGHSERRRIFGETVEMIDKKSKAVIYGDLKAILCIGEDKKMSLEDNELGRPTEADIENPMFGNLQKILNNISIEVMDKVIIAYEPVWAIGTGKAATGAYVSAIASAIRKILAKKYGRVVAKETKILYGGSVDSYNAGEFLHQPEIDGILAGNASLKVGEFIKICQIASEK